ncbi:Superoxide dismutase [Cu-Zn] [Nesidiocoris tenuis]|uniref:Superoxide dismutase copper chaperone n=1 Tax=Nesidiocoris tenuis TaxID=355587 RepID=A0ABN7AKT7_9HEMI|nr:Superoxide dismutase [Cu-Zn] [Nesidiocoris tenuis]
MSLLIEFAVKMTCKSCVDAVSEKLKNVKGVENFDIDLDKGIVLVETELPSSYVQDQIESTGRVAVINGYGSRLSRNTSGVNTAAVAILGGTVGYSTGGIRGIVRFIQADPDMCVIDGTIDGLTPGKHGIHVHECGDLSNGCESVGNHFDLSHGKHGDPSSPAGERHTGDLGNIEAGADGRSIFRIKDRLLKVSDVIGRSVVVTQNEDDCGKGSNEKSKIDGNSGNRLACGIISRAAGLFQNTKKICACDGVTIWDERNVPAAGASRREFAERKKEADSCCAR